MKLFLAVPFSSRVDAAGVVEAGYRTLFERLLSDLRAKGHEVFCALEYSGWNINGMTTPEQELAHDFSVIDASDKLIVLLEERVSAGVQLENGYAYAKQKSIETYQIGKAAWSNVAFARLNKLDIVPVQDEHDFAVQVLARN